MNRNELSRQIDVVLSGSMEPWAKVLLVDAVASAHHAEAARIRAEVCRARLAHAVHLAKADGVELHELRQRADLFAAELVSRGIELPALD